MEPGRNRELDLPADISRWTTEQVLKYFSRRSEHAAGDLILGNESYGRYLESAAAQEASVIPDQRRGAHYPRMAEDSMQGEAPGSSVGGEQPKFTAIIRRADDARTIEHVIVKFSPKITTSTGMRWGDLLFCEHLALLTLSRNGIAAARTAVLELEDRVFWEVVRFDRVGLRGRLPMATCRCATASHSSFGATCWQIPASRRASRVIPSLMMRARSRGYAARANF